MENTSTQSGSFTYFLDTSSQKKKKIDNKMSQIENSGLKNEKLSLKNNRNQVLRKVKKIIF